MIRKTLAIVLAASFLVQDASLGLPAGQAGTVPTGASNSRLGTVPIAKSSAFENQALSAASALSRRSYAIPITLSVIALVTTYWTQNPSTPHFLSPKLGDGMGIAIALLTELLRRINSNDLPPDGIEKIRRELVYRAEMTTGEIDRALSLAQEEQRRAAQEKVFQDFSPQRPNSHHDWLARARNWDTNADLSPASIDAYERKFAELMPDYTKGAGWRDKFIGEWSYRLAATASSPSETDLQEVAQEVIRQLGLLQSSPIIPLELAAPFLYAHDPIDILSAAYRLSVHKSPLNAQSLKRELDQSSPSNKSPGPLRDNFPSAKVEIVNINWTVGRRALAESLRIGMGLRHPREVHLFNTRRAQQLGLTLSDRLWESRPTINSEYSHDHLDVYRSQLLRASGETNLEIVLNSLALLTDSPTGISHEMLSQARQEPTSSNTLSSEHQQQGQALLTLIKNQVQHGYSPHIHRLVFPLVRKLVDRYSSELQKAEVSEPLVQIMVEELRHVFPYSHWIGKTSLPQLLARHSAREILRRLSLEPDLPIPIGTRAKIVGKTAQLTAEKADLFIRDSFQEFIDKEFRHLSHHSQNPLSAPPTHSAEITKAANNVRRNDLPAGNGAPLTAEFFSGISERSLSEESRQQVNVALGIAAIQWNSWSRRPGTDPILAEKTKKALAEDARWLVEEAGLSPVGAQWVLATMSAQTFWDLFVSESFRNGSTTPSAHGRHSPSDFESTPNQKFTADPATSMQTLTDDDRKNLITFLSRPLHRNDAGATQLLTQIPWARSRLKELIEFVSEHRVIRIPATPTIDQKAYIETIETYFGVRVDSKFTLLFQHLCAVMERTPRNDPATVLIAFVLEGLFGGETVNGVTIPASAIHRLNGSSLPELERIIKLKDSIFSEVLAIQVSDSRLKAYIHSLSEAIQQEATKRFQDKMDRRVIRAKAVLPLFPFDNRAEWPTVFWEDYPGHHRQSPISMQRRHAIASLITQELDLPEKRLLLNEFPDLAAAFLELLRVLNDTSSSVQIYEMRTLSTNEALDFDDRAGNVHIAVPPNDLASLGRLALKRMKPLKQAPMPDVQLLTYLGESLIDGHRAVSAEGRTFWFPARVLSEFQTCRSESLAEYMSEARRLNKASRHLPNRDNPQRKYAFLILEETETLLNQFNEPRTPLTPDEIQADLRSVLLEMRSHTFDDRHLSKLQRQTLKTVMEFGGLRQESLYYEPILSLFKRLVLTDSPFMESKPHVIALTQHFLQEFTSLAYFFPDDSPHFRNTLRVLYHKSSAEHSASLAASKSIRDVRRTNHPAGGGMHGLLQEEFNEEERSDILNGPQARQANPATSDQRRNWKGRLHAAAEANNSRTRILHKSLPAIKGWIHHLADSMGDTDNLLIYVADKPGVFTNSSNTKRTPAIGERLQGVASIFVQPGKLNTVLHDGLEHHTIPALSSLTPEQAHVAAFCAEGFLGGLVMWKFQVVVPQSALDEIASARFGQLQKLIDRTEESKEHMRALFERHLALHDYTVSMADAIRELAQVQQKKRLGKILNDGDIADIAHQLRGFDYSKDQEFFGTLHKRQITALRHRIETTWGLDAEQIVDLLGIMAQRYARSRMDHPKDQELGIRVADRLIAEAIVYSRLPDFPFKSVAKAMRVMSPMEFERFLQQDRWASFDNRKRVRLALRAIQVRTISRQTRQFLAGLRRQAPSIVLTVVVAASLYRLLFMQDASDPHETITQAGGALALLTAWITGFAPLGLRGTLLEKKTQLRRKIAGSVAPEQILHSRNIQRDFVDHLPIDGKGMSIATPLLTQAKQSLGEQMPNLPAHIAQRINHTRIIVSEEMPTLAQVLLHESEPIILLHSSEVRRLSRTQLLFALGHELGHVVLSDADWSAGLQLEGSSLEQVRAEIEDRCDLLGLSVVKHLYPAAPLEWVLNVFNIWDSLENIKPWPWPDESHCKDPHRADPDRIDWLQKQSSKSYLEQITAEWDFEIFAYRAPKAATEDNTGSRLSSALRPILKILALLALFGAIQFFLGTFQTAHAGGLAVMGAMATLSMFRPNRPRVSWDELTAEQKQDTPGLAERIIDRAAGDRHKHSKHALLLAYIGLWHFAANGFGGVTGDFSIMAYSLWPVLHVLSIFPPRVEKPKSAIRNFRNIISETDVAFKTLLGMRGSGETTERLDSALDTFKKALNAEHEQMGPAIHARATDLARSLYAVFEQVENDWFNTANQPGHWKRDFYMMSIPFVSLNAIAKDFGMDGFADRFRDRLMAEYDRRAITAGLHGSRIFLTASSRHDLKQVMSQVIQQTISQMLKEVPAVHPQRRRLLEERLSQLRFFASHVNSGPQSHGTAYEPLRTYPGNDADREKVVAALKARYPKGSVQGEARMKALYEYWTDRRYLMEASAAYWLEQLAQDPELERSAPSFYLEHLLDDYFRQLNANLELVEKYGENESLRQEINRRVQGSTQVLILENDDFRSIERLIAELPDRRIRSSYYAFVNEGRENAPPLFDYHHRHLPRPMKPYKQMAHAFDALYYELETFPAAELPLRYARYRARLYEALLRSYRDDRLPEVYKYQWVSELLAAEDDGALDEVRQEAENSLKVLRSSPYQQDKDLVKSLENTLAEQKKGRYIARRPVGDEVAYVIRVGQRWFGGLAEFNKANAFTKTHKPDERDHHFHVIILGYREALHALKNIFPGLSLLEAWQRVVHQWTGKLMFTPNEKVSRPGLPPERMNLYRLRSDVHQTGPVYAMNGTDDIYRRDGKQWKPAPDLTRDDLDPLSISLSLTGVADPRAFPPSDFISRFDAWELEAGRRKKGLGEPVNAFFPRLIPWTIVYRASDWVRSLFSGTEGTVRMRLPPQPASAAA